MPEFLLFMRPETKTSFQDMKFILNECLQELLHSNPSDISKQESFEH